MISFVVNRKTHWLKIIFSVSNLQIIFYTTSNVFNQYIIFELVELFTVHYLLVLYNCHSTVMGDYMTQPAVKQTELSNISYAVNFPLFVL